MRALRTINPTNVAELFDHTVVDQAGENLGTVHSLWNNHDSSQLEFLGVKTDWLFGSNHVVPAGKAKIDEVNRTIQVPYTLALIKGAPSVQADAEITDAQEAEIFRYYGGARGTITTASTRPAEAAATGTAAALSTGEAAAAAGAPAKDTARQSKAGEDIEVPLSEEQIKVGKRTVDAGAVRLRKVIRTEIVNQPVEVKREDVVVERVSAEQVPGGAAKSDFKEEVIDVPLAREEAVVSKEAQVTGAVRVNKTATAETQNVSETVRKEDVEVSRDGKPLTRGDERTDR